MYPNDELMYPDDDLYIRKWDSVLLDENLSYEEEPIAILDREVRKLRSKEIASVKVQLKNRPVEESTWEAEGDMHERYPHLFVDSGATSRHDIIGFGVVSRHENKLWPLLLIDIDTAREGSGNSTSQPHALEGWENISRINIFLILVGLKWETIKVMDYSPERLAKLYINKIVRLQGIPVSIVSDQDPEVYI
ncbi:hypothetical protein MTR67_023521 [Solanum verrucosum]|uniref:Uncharacterized protein n=1 Tax=Solanum verrucosum TaxID=315347 RepID=A0AAF0QVC8_SOLVR|nr:hypothetical protein MTR67_023521 [Solanum verrucosum]